MRKQEYEREREISMKIARAQGRAAGDEEVDLHCDLLLLVGQ